MISIGRVCVKTAGRDAGQLAVVIDVLDNNTVVIDGQVRRRKCNVMHLEPTSKFVTVDKDASHNAVVAALKDVGITVTDRKPKKAVPRPQNVPVQPAAKSAKPAPAKKASVKTSTSSPA